MASALSLLSILSALSLCSPLIAAAQDNSAPSTAIAQVRFEVASSHPSRPGASARDGRISLGADRFDTEAATVGQLRLSFAVASVRPDKSTGRPTSNFPMGPGRTYVPRGGVFRATHILLLQYIAFAYNLTDSQMTSLAAHVPDWVVTEGFDITAQVEGTASKDQLRLMMQSLLEDRFKLAIRKENREVPVLAFVLAKPGTTGPHLVPHSSDPPCPPTAPQAEAQETVSAGFPLACHGIVTLPPSAPGRFRVGARDVTLSFLADALSGSVLADRDRPLIDRTGLRGTFDFVLECTDLNGPSAPSELSPSEPSGPDFREALQEQLGLKLESQKGTVETFVVDHVEHPADN